MAVPPTVPRTAPVSTASPTDTATSSARLEYTAVTPSGCWTVTVVPIMGSE